jgi:hypothetical protein
LVATNFSSKKILAEKVATDVTDEHRSFAEKSFASKKLMTPIAASLHCPTKSGSVQFFIRLLAFYSNC